MLHAALLVLVGKAEASFLSKYNVNSLETLFTSLKTAENQSLLDKFKMYDRPRWTRESISQFSTISATDRSWEAPPPSFETHARRDSQAISINHESPPAFSSDDRPPPYKRIAFDIRYVQETTSSPDRTPSPDTDFEDQRTCYANRHRRVRQSVSRTRSSRSSSRGTPSQSNPNCLDQSAPLTDPNSSGWSRVMLDSLFGLYLGESSKRKFRSRSGRQPRKSIPFDHPVYDMSADEQVKLRQRGIDPVAVAEMKASGRPTPI